MRGFFRQLNKIPTPEEMLKELENTPYQDRVQHIVVYQDWRKWLILSYFVCFASGIIGLLIFEFLILAVKEGEKVFIVVGISACLFVFVLCLKFILFVVKMLNNLAVMIKIDKNGIEWKNLLAYKSQACEWRDVDKVIFAFYPYLSWIKTKFVKVIIKLKSGSQIEMLGELKEKNEMYEVIACLIKYIKSLKIKKEIISDVLWEYF